MLTIKKRTDLYDYIYDGETFNRINRKNGGALSLCFSPEEIPFIIGVLERYQKDAKHIKDLIKDLKEPAPEDTTQEEAPKKATRKRAAKKSEE